MARSMTHVSRRSMLAGSAGALAPNFAWAADNPLTEAIAGKQMPGMAALVIRKFHAERELVAGVAKQMLRRGALIMFALVLSACATMNAPPPAGAKYVAMGSSFAAGPGVSTSADTPPNRCGRSADNYAHQLARRRHLALTDVSCGGATTTNILGPWNEIPPQINAVDSATRLVTVTIGGNDLGYMAGLLTASACVSAAPSAIRCTAVTPPTEQGFAQVEQHMTQIAAEVHRRAPAAQLIFVDYAAVLPPHGTCAATPLSAAQADASREIARRLAAITARVARASGAGLLKLSTLSESHNVCADAPWMNGYLHGLSSPAGVSYHPNLAGMTAFADALERMVWR